MSGDELTITSISTLVLRIPLPEAVGDSQNLVESWWLTVAVLETSQGITGWGYNAGIGPALKGVKTLIDEAIAPALIGCDAFQVRGLWDRIYFRAHFTGDSGISFQGVAAVEIAMWDAIAKSLGQPLWRILGGAGRPKIAAYATDAGWLSLPMQCLLERTRRAVDSGFTGVKIKVGSPDPREDYARVKCVRKAIGDNTHLMVDANTKWDLCTALRHLQRLEEFNLFWVEEPLHPYDVRGHSELADKLATPILIGESITSLHMFRDFIEARAVDILQPDALKLGGISGWCDAAALGRANGLPIVPAIWDMMQVHAHLCATIPNALMFEYIPWLLHIFKFPVRAEEGFVFAPEEPGAGTEILPDAVERYGVKA